MNKNLSFNIFTLLLIIIFLTLPFFVFGQQPESRNNQNPLSFLKNVASSDYGPYSSETDSNTLLNTVGLIINIVLGLLAVIFLVLTIYSGMRWMTAQGNEEEISKAKSVLVQAIMGLVIVITSWGIWELIARLWLSNL